MNEFKAKKIGKKLMKNKKKILKGNSTEENRIG